MRTITLKGRPIVSGHIEGLALVSMKPISFLGGVDPDSGIIIEKGHDLQGKNIAGKVLCFPNGHGSTVGSYVLYSLAKKGIGPKAIINQSADPVIVVGAIIADISMIDQVDIKQIETDDEVEVDGERGIVKVRKK
jgi:predicted aconitase with swiveling domain